MFKEAKNGIKKFTYTVCAKFFNRKIQHILSF